MGASITPAFVVRLVYHTLILVLLLVKVVDWNYVNASYGRSLRRSFTFLFSPSDAPIPTITSNGVTNLQTQIFTFDDFEVAVNRVVQSFFSKNNISTAQFQYGYRQEDAGKKSCGETPGPISIEAIQWASPTHYVTHESKLYSPFNFSASSYLAHNRSEFFFQLDTLRLKFDLCNIEQSAQFLLKTNECNYWHVIVEYQSMSQMYLDTIVTATLQKSCSEGGDYATPFRDITTFTDLFIIFFGTLYFYLVCLDIRLAWRVYRDVELAHRAARNRHKYKNFFANPTEEPPGDSTGSSTPAVPPISALYDWEEIPFGVKRSFHPYWSIFTLLGLALVLAEAWQSFILNEDRYINLSVADKLQLGGCCILLFVSWLQFTVMFPSIYAIGSTMQTVVPRMLSFVVGFIPMFLGFVVIAMVLFGSRMGLMKNITQTSWGLFAFMNGDSIQPIVLLMTAQSYVTGILFSVIFMLIMAYLMLNVLIAIVEEAYFLSRRHERTLEAAMWSTLEQMARPSLQKSAGAAPTSKTNESSPHDEVDGQAEDSESDDDNSAWMKDLFSPDRNIDPRMLTSDPLLLSLAEETAENYILGKSHFEYSKMMDYLVEHLSKE